MRHFASPSLARLAIIAITVVAASCSRSPLTGPPDAKLTYSQVKTIAEQTAKSQGIALNEFDEPVMRFEGSGAKHEWLVYFQMKSPPPPGGHFLIVVDDSTSKANYHPGE
jgi:hypothetical protein